ncbi:hypothetical protein LWI28_023332 [Acer negundo]|uniref:RING-type domain-containing protein n=1 Tax=Acer negundo TaxID=4023 RepID=A0AAD5JHG1_ACENE|nr:hypothetical protein LWI28_023332 [Acer negundo]KAK4854167.1 hypothetical protein QYF36_019945 [Acer negundo]
MGFLEEAPDLIVNHFLYKAAVIFTLLRWTIAFAIRFRNRNRTRTSNSTTSSSRHHHHHNHHRRTTCASQTIKDNLALTSFGEIRCRIPEISDTCAVCLGDLEGSDLVRDLRNCCHVFHQDCLDKWVDHHKNCCHGDDDNNNHKNCPLCRTPLLTYSQTLEYEFPKSNEPDWAVERILYLFGDDLLT